MLRGGVILLSMMLPLCMWAADYSKYTHVPGNYIDLNPTTNSTTTHDGCGYEEKEDNVGNIKNGRSSTYHIYVDKMRAPAAEENPVIDIIQRKIKEVILESPEPEDYEVVLDKVTKECKEEKEN